MAKNQKSETSRKTTEFVMLSFLLVVLGLILTLRVDAQDNSSYRLHVPNATEYIERITEIAQLQDPPLDWPTRSLYYSLTEMTFRRFPDLTQVDYKQILAAYDAMGIGRDEYFPQRGQWVETILVAWLQQTQPDLNSNTELRFEDFQIGISAYDFDGDGQSEYVLDVIKGQPVDRHECLYQAEYVNYLVVQPHSNGYQFIATPLRWNGYRNLGYGKGGQIERDAADINADGLLEWLVVIGGYTGGGPAMGYANTGQLYVLGWRDGRLIDLAALGDGNRYPYSVTVYGEDAGVCHGPIPRDITWEFINLDDDEAQEILQHQIYLDNWECIARETRVIDWNAQEDRYVQVDTRRDFPDDSQNCARRQAEEAMWAENFTEALEHYERALTLSSYVDPFENDPQLGEYSRERMLNRRITYDQYHMARMALAYLLTKQPEKAKPILESLYNQEFSYEPVRYFVDALLAAPDTPIGACLAAYTTFAQHLGSSSAMVTYYFGLTLEQYYGSYNTYSPELIGCDAPQMIVMALQTTDLTTDRLPTEYLNELGVSIRKSLQADFNGDGIGEWLLWPESPMEPFFFTVDDTNHYVVSTAAVDPFNHADQIHLWSLPDEAGIAIGYLTQGFARFYPEPWACAYDPVCGMSGGNVQCSPDGFIGLTLWRMEGLSLTPILDNAEVCHADFEALFPDGEGSTQIDGGELIFLEDGAFPNRPVQYVWDPDSKAFVEITARIESTPVFTPSPTAEPQYRSFNEAVEAGDYLAALTILDETAAGNQDYYLDNPESLYAYRYNRAFILEALDRPDAALMEYVMIYEAGPDSTWGMLAALHLEPVDP